MRAFRLTLTPDQLNAVIAALGRQPHDDVFHLLQSIHAQAGAQVEAAQARAEARRTDAAPAPGAG